MQNQKNLILTPNLKNNKFENNSSSETNSNDDFDFSWCHGNYNYYSCCRY